MIASTKSSAVVAAALAAIVVAAPTPLGERGLLDRLFGSILPANVTDLYGAPPNDFNCKSDRNPVVFLHGLSANREWTISTFQKHLQENGWCTYSQTYGEYSMVPFIGGLRPMRETAPEIAAFIRQVKERTGAQKIDLVGHSEGGVHSLYVPMTQLGIKEIIGRSVALGPAVHGAMYFGFADLWYLGGEATRFTVANILHTIGCPACDDMAPDGAIFNDFKAASPQIAQAGIKTSIIVSNNDILVKPETSIVNEPGVRNIVVQDHCPEDGAGHAGLSYDRNVWQLVKNELEEQYDRKVDCDYSNLILPF